MKRIFNYIVCAVAILAIAACEDVPAPYELNMTPSEKAEATGTGTLNDPYNVAKALDIINSGEYTESNVYVKGIISQIDGSDNIAQYGNMTYYISDNGKVTKQLEVYRGYGLNGNRFTSEDEIQLGDTVIVCGVLTMYGSTAEFTQGSSIVYINGKGTSSSEPAVAKGTGTLADPFNAVAANEYIAANLTDGQNSTESFYIAGVVSSVKECSASFGNATFYISDNGKAANTFYVYRVYGLNNQKITSDTFVEAGDTVVVYAQLTNYKGTYETVQNGGYVYSIKKGNGGSTETPEVTPGKTSRNTPYTISQAQADQSGKPEWIKAYIVGSIPQSSGTSYIDNTEFGVANAQTTNIVVAASATETAIAKCMAVQLPSGSVRSALNLVDNPANLGKEVLLYGSLEKYFGAAGIKSVSYAEIGGKGYGTDPDGAGTGSGEQLEGAKGDGTAANPYNAVAALNVIASGNIPSTEVYVYGKVSQIDEIGTSYGNATYWISEDGTKNNQFEIFRGKGIGGETISSADYLKLGDDVVVCGVLVNYNGSVPEMTTGSRIVSLNGKTEGSNGGDDNQGGGNDTPGEFGADGTLTFSQMGYENAQSITTITMADGTTLTFDGGGNQNTPKYYTSGTSLRMYPKNSIAISSKKTIASISIKCTDPYNGTVYNGGDALKAAPGQLSKTSDTQVDIKNINSKSITITNDHSSNSGGQLRMLSIAITYAE